jgi:transposase
VRTATIQVAWLSSRHQRASALSLWFHGRVQRNGGRMRKTAIVALARKLLVAFWKYMTSDVVIEGAARPRLGGASKSFRDERR